MVTALTEQAERVRGLEAGADDFISKPVDTQLLFARLRALLRVKQVFDAWRSRAETARSLGFEGAGDAARISGGARVLAGGRQAWSWKRFPALARTGCGWTMGRRGRGWSAAERAARRGDGGLPAGGGCACACLPLRARAENAGDALILLAAEDLPQAVLRASSGGERDMWRDRSTPELRARRVWQPAPPAAYRTSA